MKADFFLAEGDAAAVFGGEKHFKEDDKAGKEKPEESDGEGEGGRDVGGKHGGQRAVRAKDEKEREAEQFEESAEDASGVKIVYSEVAEEEGKTDIDTARAAIVHGYRACARVGVRLTA